MGPGPDSIIDKQVWVSDNACIGYGDDFTPNQEEPQILNTGITLVGKGAKVPKAMKVGRNCKIGCWVEAEDFGAIDSVPSGSSIAKQVPRRYQV